MYADLHQRNTLPLFNLARQKYLTAADSTLHTVTEQMNNPLFSKHPVEMGADLHQQIFEKLANDSLYKLLFKTCFASGQPALNWKNIKDAISSFVKSIESKNSPWDRFNNGDSTALSAMQKKGKQLFFSTKLSCANCHGGPDFSSPKISKQGIAAEYYFNTGLYNTDNDGGYPLYDQGLYEHTKNKKDMGKYRVPTLRNLAFTAPYYHDGSGASLTEVINNYAAGGRQITEGANAGNGSKNKYKHPLIKSFSISVTEKKALICFLLSLSDSGFIQNPAYQNPFGYDETKNK